MKRFKMTTHAGNHFDSVAANAKAEATERGCEIEFDFNGINCVVDKDTNLEWLWRDYANAHRMEWKEIGANCVEVYPADVQAVLDRRNMEAELRQEQQRKEQQQADEKEKAAFAEKVKGIELELADEAGWKEFVEANKDDGYGACCVEYAEGWGKLMQAEIAQGKTVAECAQKTSYELGFFGITGFMYGCAVSMLAKCWKHGEELRRWHNKDTQIGDEGEKANEEGGVLNPALLSFG